MLIIRTIYYNETPKTIKIKYPSESYLSLESFLSHLFIICSRHFYYSLYYWVFIIRFFGPVFKINFQTISHHVLKFTPYDKLLGLVDTDGALITPIQFFVTQFRASKVKRSQHMWIFILEIPMTWFYSCIQNLKAKVTLKSFHLR